MNRRTFLLGAGASLLPPPAIALAPNFPRSLANVLLSEGGNDDDPQDPGGRTSRGIIQREWTRYRQTHAGLPADVWEAPQSAIEDIYRTDYWLVVAGDQLPLGLDYTLFDYGVNSGVGQAGRVLRRVLGLNNATDKEWRIGPTTLRAIAARDPRKLVVAVNNERLAFLKRLPTYPRFGHGWDKRVMSVNAISLRMAGVKPAFGLLQETLTPAYGPGKAYAVTP